MTLIIGALSNEVVTLAADCLYVDPAGNAVEDNASKVMKLITNDAVLLVAFAGRAFIDDPQFGISAEQMEATPYTMNWLADYSSRQGAAHKPAEEFVKKIGSELTSLYQNYYPHTVPAIVFMLLGRERNKARKPLAFRISNIDPALDHNVNSEQATPNWTVEKIELPRKPKMVLIDGMMPATRSRTFLGLKKEVLNLLGRKNSHVWARAVRSKLLQMITHASADPASKGRIGDRMVGALLDVNDKLLVQHVPDEGIRAFPGIAEENIIATGIRVTGHVLGEGDYQIGN